MTDQLTPEGIARCRELLAMYEKTELGVEREISIRPEIERFLFDHAAELLYAFESDVRQSAVVSDLVGNVTHLDHLLGLTEVPEECPEYAPDGYAAELDRVVSVLVEHNEDMRQPGQTVHDVVGGAVAEASEARTERRELIELLAAALGISRPIEDLFLREGVLKFLTEELIAARDRVLAAFVKDHGGAPAQGPDGEHWHFFRQFTSDVWDERAPAHKLHLRVVTVNRVAAGEFAAELRDWAEFIQDESWRERQ